MIWTTQNKIYFNKFRYILLFIWHCNTFSLFLYDRYTSWSKGKNRLFPSRCFSGVFSSCCHIKTGSSRKRRKTRQTDFPLRGRVGAWQKQHCAGLSHRQQGTHNTMPAHGPQASATSRRDGTAFYLEATPTIMKSVSDHGPAIKHSTGNPFIEIHLSHTKHRSIPKIKKRKLFN